MTPHETPRPAVSGGGARPTVCGKNTPAGKPCALRAGHDGFCEYLRTLTDLPIPIVIEPSLALACSGCFKHIPYGAWMMRLPETYAHGADRYAGVRFCRSCTAAIGRVSLTMPIGPAPDPEEDA